MHFSIVFDQVSLQFKQTEILQTFSYKFSSSSPTAILGKNGSGKSSILKLMSSFLSATAGHITFFEGQEKISLEEVPNLMSVCSPFLELEQSMTCSELFDFHFSLREIYSDLDKEQFFELCFLNENLDTNISDLSSGMKQRLKLALAFCTKSRVLLLDEPCMNLDDAGIQLYTKLVTLFSANKLIAVASNRNKYEFDFCDQIIDLDHLSD